MNSMIVEISKDSAIMIMTRIISYTIIVMIDRKIFGQLISINLKNVSILANIELNKKNSEKERNVE